MGVNEGEEHGQDRERPIPSPIPGRQRHPGQRECEQGVGDPVLAEPGGTVFLETASLEVEARIVDMKYGSSALPNESFFERMTIELRAMPKE